MRARLALDVSGQVCELREVVLRNKPPAMLEASPKGTVPVLVLSNGEVIDESLDIMLWALGCNDPERWLTPESDSRQFARVDAAWFASLPLRGVQSWLTTIVTSERFERIMRHPAT